VAQIHTPDNTFETFRRYLSSTTSNPVVSYIMLFFMGVCCHSCGARGASGSATHCARSDAGNRLPIDLAKDNVLGADERDDVGEHVAL
jgi:hypothetical protein